jgi:hypothetical protein
MATRFPTATPLTMGGIVSGTFQIYGMQFGRILLTSVIYFVLPGVVMGGLALLGVLAMGVSVASATQNLEAAGGLFLCLLVPAVLAILVLGLWGNLSIIDEALTVYRGAPFDLRSSMRAGGHHWISAFVANILQFLACLGVLLPGLVLFAALARSGSGTGLACLMGPVVIVAAVGIFYLSIRWLVTMPALVDGRLDGVEALGRSWQLSVDNVWRCIGFSLIFWFLGLLINSGVVGIYRLVLGGLFGSGLAVQLMNIAGSAAIWLLWQPVPLIAGVLLYNSLRLRHERGPVAAIGPRTDGPAEGMARQPEGTEVRPGPGVVTAGAAWTASAAVPDGIMAAEPGVPAGIQAELAPETAPLAATIAPAGGEAEFAAQSAPVAAAEVPVEGKVESAADIAPVEAAEFHAGSEAELAGESTLMAAAAPPRFPRSGAGEVPGGEWAETEPESAQFTTAQAVVAPESALAEVAGEEQPETAPQSALP